MAFGSNLRAALCAGVIIGIIQVLNCADECTEPGCDDPFEAGNIYARVEYEHLPDADPSVDNDPDDGISVYLCNCRGWPDCWPCHEIVGRYETNDDEDYNLVIEGVDSGEYMLYAEKGVPSVAEHCADVYCAESPVFEHSTDKPFFIKLGLTYCRTICPY